MNEELLKLALNNRVYFANDEFSQRFDLLVEIAEKLSQVVRVIENFAGDYDFDATTRANGYWSFIYVCKSAISRALKVCHAIEQKRNGFFFRRNSYKK